MPFLRNLKANMYKILTGYGFYICIAFTVILCFSSNVYDDPITNDKYSAISAYLNFDKKFMLGNFTLCSLMVMRSGIGSWLTMFIPIISAFAYIPLACDEYEAKSVRFEMFRCSKTSFNISRFVTACITGGIAVTIGFMIYAALVYCMFPSYAEYSTGQQQIIKSFLNNNSSYLAMLTSKSWQIFLYGVISVTPAITLTCIMKNKYLVMCIPFFLKYALDQTSLRLQSKSWLAYKSPNILLNKIATVIDPDALAAVTDYGELTKYIVIYNAVLFILAIVIYMTVQNRRIDCGE